MGSSPLTRGKPCVRRRVRTGRGLTPAHAGKTAAGRPHLGRPRAHPRSRGENTSWTRRPAGATGSSPLTRGKPPFPVIGRFLLGLIPAHAGKTSAVGRYPRSRAAHPRSRGENHYEYARHETIKGSSPLTRGKPYGPGARGFGGGLIPAHAGKTNQEGEKRTLRGAHPRSRGENVLRAILAIVSAGSSPLTRGKHPHARTRSYADGLIPAHAGKTLRQGN